VCKPSFPLSLAPESMVRIIGTTCGVVFSINYNI
jgi:hypothetical protein